MSTIIYNFVKKYNITKTIFSSYFAIIFLITYFLLCTLFGEKGLVEYFNLQNKITKQDLTKQQLFSKMKTKKQMVDGMNINSLDLDLLDEEARKNLGYSNKNEIVIYKKINQ